LNKERKGKLFVISAPSGTGKSSLIKYLTESFDNVELSISATTRLPRDGEEDGKHYFFMSNDEFNSLKKDKHAFIENAIVHDYQYGTPRSYIEYRVNHGINIILDIDVQGFKQIQNAGIENTSIFIIPPSLEELKSRLVNRGLDSDEVINKRLSNAINELEHAKDFDYKILNDNFDLACRTLSGILINGDLPSPDNNNEKILRDLLS
jgi:guanylate kinase|tara:strand:+ start:1968 stop:2588 length:621 start_codon:yes stop_codon:yes gene_type:complete